MVSWWIEREVLWSHQEMILSAIGYRVQLRLLIPVHFGRDADKLVFSFIQMIQIKPGEYIESKGLTLYLLQIHVCGGEHLFNLGWIENKHQPWRLTGCFGWLYILVPSRGNEQNPQPPLKQTGLVRLLTSMKVQTGIRIRIRIRSFLLPSRFTPTWNLLWCAYIEHWK